MLVSPASLAAFAAVFSIVYLLRYCQVATVSTWRSFVKTASTALLAAAAFASGGPVLLGVALLLGALGDLMLSRQGQAAFLVGLISFAAAHLLYVLLFLLDGEADLAQLLNGWEPVAVVGLLGLGVAMARRLWNASGDLRWPVMAYIAIIMAMGLAALALPAGQRGLPLLAAVCFIASDAILSAELFLLGSADPLRRITPYAIWALYWTAQALFLLAYAPVLP